MIRIQNIKVPLDADADAPLLLALKKIGVRRDQVTAWRIAKKSVDARDKGNVHFVMAVDAALKNEDALLRAARPGTWIKTPDIPALPRHFRDDRGIRPVVVGMGPGGLFAALALARQGMRLSLIHI